MRRVAIECGLCRSGRTRRPAWSEVRGWPADGESKMTGTGRGEKRFARPPGTHKLRWRGVMVEPAPVTTFKVLARLFVSVPDSRSMIQRCLAILTSFEAWCEPAASYPVFGGFFFSSRPFDQQPFLRVRFRFS